MGRLRFQSCIRGPRRTRNSQQLFGGRTPSVLARTARRVWSVSPHIGFRFVHTDASSTLAMRRERAHLDTHWHALGIHQVQDDSRVSSENTTHPAAQCVNLVGVSKPPPSMQLSTTETIPGHTIEKSIGLVEGSTVRSKNVGRDLMASLKNFVGGELKGYTELLEESRKEATNRMIAKAKKKGANAILNVRYTTSNIAPGASEILVYGTAVIAAPHA